MSAVETQIEIDEWCGLYRESWKGVICDESFAHPAKFSRALIQKIYEHVIEEGWAGKGNSVVDPFGGVALGAFPAMQHGLVWYGCELEEKFVTLGNQNIALWNERYSRMPSWGTARLLQGDSRKLARVLSAAGCCVSSPPYVSGGHHTDVMAAWNANGGGHGVTKDEAGYGQSQGQLGAMKEGDHEIAVSSPPYNLPASQDHNGSRGGQRGTTPSEKGAFVKYGNTEGQLEGLSMDGFAAAISSPPFSHPDTRDRSPVNGDKAIADFMNRAYTVDRQGQDERNLAALPQGEFNAAISSPPYEGNGKSDYLMSDDGRTRRRDEKRGFRQGHGCFRGSEGAYGNSDGQLGVERAETFWSASRLILEQLHQVIVPGGHAVFVVKAFVRDKKIVDFPAQWAQLCEAVGFRLLHDHHALLTEEYGSQDTMTGEGVKPQRTVERKSFFRRLAESKGSPRIDHENVLCFERL